jgi:hypothetical protein
MRDNDEFDRMLHAALSTYADPGPDSGLERRILARIDVASRPGLRRNWILGALALPAAACLVFLMTLPKTQPVQSVHTTEPHPLSLPAPAAHGAPRIALSAVPPLRSRRPVRIQSQATAQDAVRTGSLPKRDVFPSPQPLTPGERALAEFATQVPMVQRQAILQAQMQDEKPLRIAELDIPFLETPSQGNN